MSKSPIPGESVLFWYGILAVYIYIWYRSLLAWCPSSACFPSLVSQTRRIKQKPTPRLWLGRKIPFDPEATLGLLPCMEEPANSSGKKKVLRQTRCNLLSACQHLECWQELCSWACIELPSLSLSEVALMC